MFLYKIKWYRDGPIDGSLNCHSQAEEGVVQRWAYRWKLKLSQSGKRRCGTGMGL